MGKQTKKQKQKQKQKTKTKRQKKQKQKQKQKLTKTKTKTKKPKQNQRGKQKEKRKTYLDRIMSSSRSGIGFLSKFRSSSSRSHSKNSLNRINSEISEKEFADT